MFAEEKECIHLFFNFILEKFHFSATETEQIQGLQTHRKFELRKVVFLT
jgi:hypothetical protein